MCAQGELDYANQHYSASRLSKCSPLKSRKATDHEIGLIWHAFAVCVCVCVLYRCVCRHIMRRTVPEKENTSSTLKKLPPSWQKESFCSGCSCCCGFQWLFLFSCFFVFISAPPFLLWFFQKTPKFTKVLTYHQGIKMLGVYLLLNKLKAGAKGNTFTEHC